MPYEVDSFGFVPGFIKKSLRLMPEEDLMSDENMRKSPEAAKYDCWKRFNIIDLFKEYDWVIEVGIISTGFVKIFYREVLEKENKKL